MYNTVQLWVLRHGGLMVNKLDSRLSAPSLSLGQGHNVVLTVPLSSLMYKRIPVNL